MTAVLGEEAVRGAGRGRRAGGGVFCVVLLGLTLGALGHVAVKAKHLEVAGDLGKERIAQVQLHDRQRHLEIEISALKDPGRLTELARENFGMRHLEPMEIRVRPGASATAAKKPTGGQK